MMKPRHGSSYGCARLWGLIVPCILLFACASQAADPHYALATSASELFIFRDEGKWNAKSWSRLYIAGGTATLAGVATDGRYVYIADNSTEGRLIVGEIGNLGATPTWTQVANLPLVSSDGTKKVRSPTRLAADGLGGVYVIGGASSGHSYFAHVKPTLNNWTTPVVSIGDLPGSIVADVAVGKSGATGIVAHSKDTPTGTRESQSSRVAGGDVLDIKSLTKKAYNARAVAIHSALGTDGFAYVVNNNADSPTTKGSVRVVDVATGDPKGSDATELAPDLIPEDVTTFTIGADYYLGIIGHNVALTQGQAWRVRVGIDGMPVMTDVVTAVVPLTTGHQAAASHDGALFWYVSETGTMDALNTASWTQLAGFDGLVGAGVKLENVTAYLIPEPASILSLTGLLAGCLALIRRRR